MGGETHVQNLPGIGVVVTVRLPALSDLDDLDDVGDLDQPEEIR